MFKRLISLLPETCGTRTAYFCLV